jgi:hypothetical protein
MKVLFFALKSRLLKNGEAPIILRVTIDGQSEDARIQRSVPLKMWNNVKGCSKGKDRASVELNCYIESLTVRLYQIHKELLCQEALVIPKHLLVKLFSKEERRIVLGTMKMCMDDWTALIGKEYQKSTLSRYGNCYELLEIVIHEFYRKEYISFNELKGEFIDAFEMHLRIVRKLSQNTLTKYMSCFRKIMYQDELLLMWKYIKNHAVNVLI